MLLTEIGSSKPNIEPAIEALILRLNESSSISKFLNLDIEEDSFNRKIKAQNGTDMTKKIRKETLKKQ